jgi:hypothetical protein
MPRSTSVPKGRRIVVGFAGSGTVSQDAVTDLLNDWLEVEGDKTKNDILTFFPVGPQYNNENLEKVLTWGEEAALPFYLFAEDEDDLPDWASEGEGKSVTKDAAADLVKVLAQEAERGAETALVLLWGQEDEEIGEDESKVAEHFLDLATSAQIPVKDLTAALDDLGFSETPAEDAAPEPEPEPEPEPATKPRGRARAKKAEPAPLADEETPLEDEEPEEAAKPAEAEKPAVKAAEVAQAVKEIVSPNEDKPEVVEMSLLEHSIRQIVLAVLEEQGLLKAKEEKKTSFYVDSDGVHFRAGRGRPPKGLKKVELTDYEMNVVRAKGLIDGE